MMVVEVLTVSSASPVSDADSSASAGEDASKLAPKTAGLISQALNDRFDTLSLSSHG
jgi:hypothetical protein